MPTILTRFGLRFMIYVNDHAPMHVHVLGNNATAKIEFESGVRISFNRGFSRSEARRAADLVSENRDLLIEKWREIHGEA